MNDEVMEKELETLVALLQPMFAARPERQSERMPLLLALRTLAPPLTLRAIGLQPEFLVTPERIRQIEAQALRILRHPSRRSQVLAVAIHYPRLYQAVFGEPLSAAVEAAVKAQPDLVDTLKASHSVPREDMAPARDYFGEGKQ